MSGNSQNISLDEAVQHYWSSRAEGYSLSTSEELSNPESVHRELLNQWLGQGSNLNKRALDMGCGPGFLAIELARLGFETTGVDSCAAMLSEARKNAQAFNIRFIEGDAALNLFAEQSFDVIASRNLVWNLPDPEKAYRQWFRWLKPKGKLIVFDGNHYRTLTDHNRHDRPHRETHRHLGNVDISIMENIAKTLPMSAVDRPDYDRNVLKSIGFTNIDTIVLNQTDGEIHDFAIICEKDYAD